MITLAALSETQLLDRFASLVRRDRHCTAWLLAHIAEIDERKLWAKHACPSMFVFCVERFHMSESVAGKRIWAARTARRFPVILRMVADGELHLSAVNLLSRHLTEENHLEVLAKAKHKSTRDVERLVAEIAPRPDVAPRVRALPLKVAPAAPRPAPARKQVEPLAPRRYRIEVTVDEETHDRLCQLQDLLRHSMPSADPAAIVSRALELLLNETMKKKAAITAQPRPSRRPGEKRTRAIPAAVRRTVWKRDGGRCAYVDQQNRRCNETASIEFHHKTPYAKGGRHDASNLALRCRAHNQYEADLDYGRAFMAAKHSARNARVTEPRPCGY